MSLVILFFILGHDPAQCIPHCDTAVKVCRAECASRTWDDCHAECERVGRECRDECP